MDAPASPTTPSPEPAAAPLTPPARLEWAKVVGIPLVTLIITTVGGYYVTDLLKEREARESNERLYAQLLTQREQSDALIRKDMFGVVINRFLADSSQQDWNMQVLRLELLANNFNQSLDLAPLFKDLARRLPGANGLTPADATALRKRLDVMASNLIYRQVNSLERRGFVQQQPVPLASLGDLIGRPVIERSLLREPLVPVADAPASTASVPSAAFSAPAPPAPIQFAVEIVDANIPAQEVEVRLRVSFGGDGRLDVDRHFWVGRYDFPMLDNTQLPLGLRAAVVITDVFGCDASDADQAANCFAVMQLVVFPAASASFKERQDYDDVLADMLRKRSRAGHLERNAP